MNKKTATANLDAQSIKALHSAGFRYSKRGNLLNVQRGYAQPDEIVGQLVLGYAQVLKSYSAKPGLFRELIAAGLEDTTNEIREMQERLAPGTRL